MAGKTTDRPLACGFRAHPLDMSVSEENGKRILNGALYLHVDVILGTGCATSKKKGDFVAKLKKFKDSFDFRSWCEGPEQELVEHNYDVPWQETWS